jgi:predicted nucleic acid-binding protein
MRLAVDTNIVLDVLLMREPFFQSSKTILGMAEKGEVEATLCATTLTTVDYILCKNISWKKSRETIGHLLELFEICPVNRAVLQSAAMSRIADFEDAVLHEAARLSNCQAIVTRNGKDFKKATLTILDPSEFLSGASQS